MDRSGLEKAKTVLVVARRTCLVHQSTPKRSLTKWWTSSMEKEEQGRRLGQALGVGVVGDQKGTKAENPVVASNRSTIIYTDLFESVVVPCAATHVFFTVGEVVGVRVSRRGKS